MKEPKLVSGMCVRLTHEFIIQHVRLGDSTLKYPDRYEKEHYGIVGGSIDNRIDYLGNRHYVEFFDNSGNFIERIGIHHKWLDEINPDVLLYTIEKIITDLEKLENKLKTK